MKVNGKHYQTIWPDPDDKTLVHYIDQRKLPFSLVVEQFTHSGQVCTAIKDMHLRGAPLIGVAAAFGLYLASLEHKPSGEIKQHLIKTAEKLEATRPTAINLRYSVERQMSRIDALTDPTTISSGLLEGAMEIHQEEIENCRMIGEHGLEIIKQMYGKKGNRRLNILTHCNAGWLACVDYGTATAPVYFRSRFRY